MKTPLGLLPDLPTLRTRLTAALDCGGSARRSVTILERKRPRMMSTFPNEIVICRLPDGQERRVFCKYEARHTHNAYGHRGGLAYEAEVYRQVLRDWPASRPRFLGVETDRKTGETWLLLEYLNRSVRVSDITAQRRLTSQRLATVMAARWIGRFHATLETRVASGAFSFLKRYDADYYLGWVRRTAKFARPWHGRFPWLLDLCERASEFFSPLLASPFTVIHGEYYAKNVLLHNQRVHPVDWESAALAPGEIDLAALTEGKGWPRPIVLQFEQEYEKARWPEGNPANFRQRLDAAHLYLHFRWLGERPEWTVREKTMWRYDHLRAAAERLSLI